MRLHVSVYSKCWRTTCCLKTLFAQWRHDMYALIAIISAMQAINIMSLGVDFEITQIVDSNVGIHAKIPK